MYNILVVDDEENIRAMVKEYAEFFGHQVTEAANGMEAVNICRDRNFDMIVMDVMMPKMDGFSACKEIRRTQKTPILMLSARGEEYEKLFGFEVGADDYMVKPFSPKELMARINAIVARCFPQEDAKMEWLTFAGVCIDSPGRNVLIDGAKVELTPKEFDLLLYMATNKNIVLTREQLLNGVWGYEFFGEDRTIDTHIKMLRSSLGPYRDTIVTIRGVGYKLEI